MLAFEEVWRAGKLAFTFAIEESESAKMLAFSFERSRKIIA